jgi:hypothetical protein
MNTQDKILLEQIEKVLLHPDTNKRMRAVGTALSRILQNQTSDEVSSETTRYSNGIGFTGAHGGIGTSMAQFYLRNGFLTPKQVQYWTKPIGKKNRPRILIYKNQLLEFAKFKQKA